MRQSSTTALGENPLSFMLNRKKDLPMKFRSAIPLLILVTSLSFGRNAVPADTSAVIAMIRCDDLGMCHTVNMAARQVMESGLPVSFSVMFACPWYQEAITLLKQHPEVSVGIHLTLNAEWKQYRWGPVSGRSAVPSIVDSIGYFFPSRASFFANKPKLNEIEIELRTQIERALHSGVKIDYVDYHMGTAVDRPELRALVEKLAKEYGLAISRYFGEQDVEGVYSAPVAGKLDTLLLRSRSLSGGAINLMVFHIGMQTAEMDALEDLNSFGLREMSKHREAELRALTSPQFRAILQAKHVRLKTYRDLVNESGLRSMKRPIQKD
jgi:chitin disaccharide deacetylase